MLFTDIRIDVNRSEHDESLVAVYLNKLYVVLSVSIKFINLSLLLSQCTVV